MRYYIWSMQCARMRILMRWPRLSSLAGNRRRSVTQHPQHPCGFQRWMHCVNQKHDGLCSPTSDSLFTDLIFTDLTEVKTVEQPWEGWSNHFESKRQGKVSLSRNCKPKSANSDECNSGRKIARHRVLIIYGKERSLSDKRQLVFMWDCAVEELGKSSLRSICRILFRDRDPLWSLSIKRTLSQGTKLRQCFSSGKIWMQ